MTRASSSSASRRLERLRSVLMSLIEESDCARRAGLEWLVVAVAHDLGRCIWIGEDVQRLSDDPVENVILRCEEYLDVLRFGERALPSRWTPEARPPQSDTSVEERTHTLYGGLWAGLEPNAVAEATALLRVRLERNGLGTADILGRTCLDAGCGSGRYTVALGSLGARSVIGIDIGLRGVVGGADRALHARAENVRFCVGSVLQLPFPDASFDLVMSNGVLHHTRDPMRGLREIRRVLRPGGRAWLFLYNSDGAYWMVRKAMREMVADIPQETTRHVLSALGIKPNRVFLLMDGLYVPIEENYTREEAEEMVRAAGFRGHRFLARGADRDLSEAVSRGDPCAVEMYGRHGDLRFWLTG